MYFLFFQFVIVLFLVFLFQSRLRKIEGNMFKLSSVYIILWGPQ